MKATDQHDYLWDKTGEPDPEIERLESVLLNLRYDPARRPPTWAAAGVLNHERPARWAWFRLAPALAAVALVMVAVMVVRWSQWRPAPASKTAWQVASLAGAPQIGQSRVRQIAQLRVGEVLETDGTSRANLRVGEIGDVDIEPNSRVRLLAAKPTEDRLALDRGTIHALISAPPRLFFVNTPVAEAIDLGCAYTLHVEEDGAGLLRVTFGWVEIETHGQQSLIPAGAAAITKPGFDPGTPFFEDATAEFKTALEKLDFQPPSAPDRASVLQTLLAQARQRDGFTLLYLMRQYRGLAPAERAQIYGRLALLVPPPPGVVRDKIIHGDDSMIDLWWDLMGVGHPRKK